MEPSSANRGNMSRRGGIGSRFPDTGVRPARANPAPPLHFLADPCTRTPDHLPGKDTHVARLPHSRP